MKKEISIEYKSYNNEYIIVFLKRGSINLFIDFAICEFVGEMEYLNMPTQPMTYMGEKGYLFHKNIDKVFLEQEIKRIADSYNI